MAAASRQQDDAPGQSEDWKILDEAKKRFKRAQDWEADVRKLFVEDVKFGNGDSDNGWQWPDNVKTDRDVNNRPCLTINKTGDHVRRLVNEARQNQPQARVKPVGERVSYDAAQLWEGIIRHIEYQSNAQGSSYIPAKQSQIEGGIGFWRIMTGYVDDRSFDQEAKIVPLDAMNVLLDCDIKTVDGSDSMWGFIFEDIDRDEFPHLYPNVQLPPAKSPGLDDRDDWIRQDKVRLAEYYRIDLTDDELLYIEDDAGKDWTGLRSEIPDGWKKWLRLYETGRVGEFRKRKVRNRQLQWYKIAGNEIVDRKDGKNGSRILPGKYIPIVRMPGRERKIEGRLYRAGIVRALKDPQRMYNYNTSGQVEVVAVQTKTPWIVAAKSIEGNEPAWANANTQNAAYLTFRHMDENGNPIPPPQRMDPPQPAAGFLEALKIAAAEMEMAAGQFQAQQQQPALERTPAAIEQRARMTDLSNYDFTDAEMQAIRHGAVILIDLLPHIYDTERVVKIRADDGTISEITINPNMEEAHKQTPTRQGEAVKVLFNPKIGRYAVEADVGPAYATQRQEAWNAFVQIVTNSPELVAKIGDLGFLAADFPMAQEIADRLRRDIEHTMPWLLKDSAVGPIVANLQAELQQSQQRIAELMEKLTEARIRLRGKEELRDIEAENAKTRRMDAITNVMSKTQVTPQMRAQMEHELLSDAHSTALDMLQQANAPTVQNQSTDAGTT